MLWTRSRIPINSPLNLLLNPSFFFLFFLLQPVLQSPGRSVGLKTAHSQLRKAVDLRVKQPSILVTKAVTVRWTGCAWPTSEATLVSLEGKKILDI